MKADFHMHTNFSKDSQSTPEEMIQESIGRGLKTICFTDHHDINFTEPGFEIDFERYFPTLQMLKEKYSNKIEILIGMEFGLQPEFGGFAKELANKYPFDFVIGSLHVVDGEDPYYGKCFLNKTDEEGYRRAFELTLESIRNVSDYDSLGHIDYVVRYGKYQDKEYSYAKYADYLDEILRHLIQNGKALELNTAGWKYGLSFAHPHQDILKRYKELGGELLTIGSDGHRPEHVAYDFHKVKDYLKDCGFEYYTEFRQRKPYFCALY